MSSLRLVLFGPPGAGKGTQAQLLKDGLNIPHISSGDLFRHHLQEGTPLGLRASSFVNRGLLVPDDVTIDIMLDKVLALPSEEGFLLDGFPRTHEQAMALDQALNEGSRGLDKVLYLSVPEEVLVQRLAERYVCRHCQAPYTRSQAKAQEESRCPKCGGDLDQRPDDSPERVQKRIEVYQSETVPVLDFYREKGLLVDIPGQGSMECVHRRLLKALS